VLTLCPQYTLLTPKFPWRASQQPCQKHRAVHKLTVVPLHSHYADGKWSRMKIHSTRTLILLKQLNARRASRVVWNLPKGEGAAIRTRCGHPDADSRGMSNLNFKHVHRLHRCAQEVDDTWSAWLSVGGQYQPLTYSERVTL